MSEKNAYGFPLREGNTDPQEVCREIFNCHEETLVFESCHNDRPIQPMDWLRREVKPDEFLFLPHGYYSAKFACGYRPEGGIHVPTNQGAAMKTGNRGTHEDRRKCRALNRHGCKN